MFSRRDPFSPFLCSALRRALIIGYLVITDDTFFLVADIVRDIRRGFILIWLPTSILPSRLGRPKFFLMMQTRRSEMFLE